ncbi:MAG: prepilin-type N-terminal cleavage/methylation domain-containing protein [Polyangiaceae bacterium]|nr:prepilin-type N-terminal cleavage/methylation domain-containing protein [Polyangiaceae bacterium]
MRTCAARGFTLVELLAVVVIVGVLSVIGVAAFRKQALGTKSIEATGSIAAIRSAQEERRALIQAYVNVSADVTSDSSLFPAVPNGLVRRAFLNDSHTDFGRWRELNPKITAEVQFGYAVVAGAPGVAPAFPASGGFPTAVARQPWYVIAAYGDGDGDGVRSRFVASSLSHEIFSELEAE